MEIPYTPPGHGVGLGERVAADDSVTELGHTAQAEVPGAVVDEVLVCLVGHHSQIVLNGQSAQGAQILFCVYGTGWIAGRAEKYGAGLFGYSAGEPFHVQTEAPILGGRYENRLGRCYLNLSYMGGVGGRWKQNFVSGIHYCHHGSRKRLYGSNSNNDVIGFGIYSVVSGELPTDCLAKLRQSRAFGVSVSQTLLDGPNGPAADVLGSPASGFCP